MAMNPIFSTILEGATPGFLVAATLLAFMPWVSQKNRWRILPIAFVLALTARYLYWRITSTIPSPENPVDFIAGLLFFVIEFLAVLGTIISYVTLTRKRNRSDDVNANIPWLMGQPNMPMVDVFICTYNEEREILERTMVGATGMSYPRYRVWVLDDGRRDWLRDLAGELGCEYLTRPDNDHAKAGNINHALGHVRQLDTPPDFISILDADFVPAPMFLRRALALFRDEKIGIVQTPQHFVNPDPIQSNLQASDAWPDEQRYFFDVLMQSKDAWGTAFCCGTSSVIRMEALEAAGDFPTTSVTEDYLLTLRLQQHGYGTAYLNERLSMGLAPEGLQEYITQRSRWCLGFIQIIRSKDGPFNLKNGLRPIDRVSLVESLLYWFAAYAFRASGIFIPIFYLLFGIHAVNVDTTEGISYFLPYYFSQIVVMAWLSGQRVLPVMTDVSQLLAAREILTAAAIGFLRPKGQKFKVTAKGGDRTKTVVQWRMMGMFGTLLLLTVLGIAFAFGGNKTLQDSSVVALYWSWYNILVLIAAMAVCVERPRLRRHERLRGKSLVNLEVGNQMHVYETADLSVGGVRLLGHTDFDVGTPVTLSTDLFRFEGKIVRRSQSDFAVAIEDSVTARSAMIREVYSGSFSTGLNQIDFTQVARKVAARLST
jgi:cellulose synthase (UDP-forming)